METLCTVKNHYNIDTVTGINVRQFIMKCNNVLTTANRSDNCLEVTAVNVDPSSSAVDSTSCTIELSVFEPPEPKTRDVLYLASNLNAIDFRCAA